MIVLGIHDGHNATAALLKGGRIVACASEERFSRVKNDLGHPFKAIDYVLSASGVSAQDIDIVGLATKETDPIAAKIKREALYSVEDYIREMHDYWEPKLYKNIETSFWMDILEEKKFKNVAPFYNIDFVKKGSNHLWGKKFNEERSRLILEQVKIPPTKIHFLDHHNCHAYYAYFASKIDPSRKTAVVTADGWGDDCNATVSLVKKNVINEICRTGKCDMARIYRFITLLLGMRPNEHEYKVMGLAPYAKDRDKQPAYKVFKELLVVDGLDFRWKKKPPDMYFYFKEKLEGIRFDGVAAGVQLWIEELLSEWVTNIMKVTKADTLCYSGGLSMNVKANKTITELQSVKDFYVPPSGADESLAMGAAFFVASRAGEEVFPLEDAYLGYEVTKAEAGKAVEPFRAGAGYKIVDNPSADMLADLLLKGKVLGRCTGRMEFGARSLGNRAILCDPSKYHNMRLINEKIKFRDFWMPFTPSILSERADDYMLNPKKIHSDYMTIAFNSTPLAREHLKAAIHPYDFTIRPQLVSKDINPEYHSLIKAFERKTGIGALLNTSLNLHGQPIVCTAKEAIETLIKSGLDGMILPGVLVVKGD